MSVVQTRGACHWTYGRAADPARRRQPGAAAGGLDEAHPAVPVLGLALDVGQGDGLEAVAQGPNLTVVAPISPPPA